MRIFVTVLCLLGAIHRLPPQETLKEVLIQIPLQVRVYRNADFVDNLVPDDFLLFEDGVRQRIEGLYYVKNGRIQRSEILPPTQDKSRSFYLFFEIASYTPEIRKAVRFFLAEVLRPSDNLMVVTPQRAYRMKSTALEALPEKELTRQLEGLFQNDALCSLPEYQTTLSDLNDVVETAAGSVGVLGPVLTPSQNKPDWPSEITRDALVIRYYSLLSALEKLRKIDERRLLDYVEMMRFQEGQKYAFFFYQRERLPRIPPPLLEEFLAANRGRRDILQTLIYLEDFHNRDFFVDETRLSRVLANAGIILHFLCFDLPRPDSVSEFEAARLASFYQKLTNISLSSGAAFTAEVSPQKLLARASTWLDEYYLVIYAPRSYAGDGKFKPIRISIKDRRYTVWHRAGYISE
jgi:hypothetical protein